MLQRIVQWFREFADHVDPVPTPAERGYEWRMGERVIPKYTMDDWPVGNKTACCPHCERKQFLMGPEGGMNTNVKCAFCHTRWNAVLGVAEMAWEFIGYGPDYNALRLAAKLVRERGGITA